MTEQHPTAAERVERRLAAGHGSNLIEDEDRRSLTIAVQHLPAFGGAPVRIPAGATVADLAVELARFADNLQAVLDNYNDRFEAHDALLQDVGALRRLLGVDALPGTGEE